MTDDTLRTFSNAALLEDGWVRLDWMPDKPWIIEAQVRVIDGRPQLLGLKLLPRGVGDPGWTPAELEMAITPEKLRRLPLQKIKQAAMALQQKDYAGLRQQFQTRIEREPGKEWPDEHYHHVADVYNDATSAGLSGIRAIQDTWTVTRQMASKYKSKATEMGLIPAGQKKIETARGKRKNGKH